MTRFNQVVEFSNDRRTIMHGTGRVLLVLYPKFQGQGCPNLDVSASTYSVSNRMNVWRNTVIINSHIALTNFMLLVLFLF